MIFLISLIVYIMIGMAYARHRYAIQTQRTKDQEFLILQGAKAREKLSEMRHGICNMNYSSMTYMGCDCGKRKEWRRLKAIVAQAPDATISSPWVALAIWPVLGVDSFLRAKKLPAPSTPNYALIAELEKENNILQ